MLALACPAGAGYLVVEASVAAVLCAFRGTRPPATRVPGPGKRRKNLKYRPLSAWSSCARKACTGACGVWRTTGVDVTREPADSQVQKKKGVPGNPETPAQGNYARIPFDTVMPCQRYLLHVARRNGRPYPPRTCAKQAGREPPQFRIRGRAGTAFHRCAGRGTGAGTKKGARCRAPKGLLRRSPRTRSAGRTGCAATAPPPNCTR